MPHSRLAVFLTAKKEAALQQLTNDDWKEVISQAQPGTLSPNQIINHPIVLTGDPTSSIPEERSPRVIANPVGQIQLLMLRLSNKLSMDQRQKWKWISD